MGNGIAESVKSWNLHQKGRIIWFLRLKSRFKGKIGYRPAWYIQNYVIDRNISEIRMTKKVRVVICLMNWTKTSTLVLDLVVGSHDQDIF